ncbi:tRNA (uridine(54)-C5)-methyltransferase TrmA [Helicobacter jaachi]|uniref:tRNA (Uridine(54)-C5)-methyltransferase TrmA n=1 Tax=Helicobacter jaachi TaxID=1677920 RepID=A0A4U8TF30_9HELI|nr:tRNA (uridine(54)-C5)-methyltransferase TrmA [Helicobacter jaachi]TLD97317.1 tRNA (uridine(54)-C5)-methyltransferase TrmA [Helicobacter jaachi]
MTCAHFHICGGCNNPLSPYKAQLEAKALSTLDEFRAFLQDLSSPFALFASPKQAFRARAEFRFYKSEQLDFAMNTLHKNARVPISKCPILLPVLQAIMPLLIQNLRLDSVLHTKLYACNLLSSLQGEAIITLIYHKTLDSAWQERARILESYLSSALNAHIHIIGRSKHQKLILSQDTLLEQLTLFEGSEKKRIYRYYKKEAQFSQPNPFINAKMLAFVFSALQDLGVNGDLLELYCGSGNFSIMLAPLFRAVLATEVVKSAIALLHENIKLNHTYNITPVRLNAFECIEALSLKRAFFRLKDVSLHNFAFDCVLIDPPRSGVKDREILHFLERFRLIVYVSCNPKSLLEDLQILSLTHKMTRFGLFDQFPHTHHRECIAILHRI